MTVINTNVSATLATNAIVRNERAMGTAMERLSTGKRINSAADDAAGLAIATKMSSQVKGLEPLLEPVLHLPLAITSYPPSYNSVFEFKVLPGPTPP